jgi:hypothetical protein
MSRTLVGLLKDLSPGFKRGFQELLESTIDTIKYRPCLNAQPNWIQEPDTFEKEYEEPIALRDWNEELQMMRGMDDESIEIRYHKERTIHQIYSDFVTEAKHGATLIVDGCISPLNPMD